MRTLALTLVPLALLACGREPVAPAMPPLSADRRTDIQVIPDNVVGAFVGTCPGGFDVLSDWFAELRIITQYDKNGELDRHVYLYHLEGLSSYYNSAQPDLVVYGGPNETQNAMWDYDNGSIVVAGPVWRVVLPGVGPIFMDVGVVKLDMATFTITHTGGSHQFWENDFAALCDALTP